MDHTQARLAIAGELRDNVQSSRSGVFDGSILPMKFEEKSENRRSPSLSLSVLRDLITRSQEGDSSAMEKIFLEFKQPLFGLAYRYTYDPTVAEDLLQETFIKVFTNIGDIQRAETFVGWLYRVAINTCLSYLRGKKYQTQKTVPISEIEGKLDEATYDSSDVVLKKPLDDAIQSLPGKLKSVFLLHDVQGFKHQEISQILGWSVGTSKSQLFKARMKLRQYLKDKQLI